MTSMTDETSLQFRFFVTYSGVKLPLKLLDELDTASLNNRNTYFRAGYDDKAQLRLLEKRTYGEAELIHRYDYHGNGQLSRAEIDMCDEDEDITILQFDATGALLSV
ncbi:DUF6156 family protein [Ampullimonas aquatilis]|uniref:DUF6156 family protein n=1 Tax=Ampullimonas aquatilis TaxID=1341549 RepID=UPI003C7411EE